MVARDEVVKEEEKGEKEEGEVTEKEREGKGEGEERKMEGEEEEGPKYKQLPLLNDYSQFEYGNPNTKNSRANGMIYFLFFFFF